MAIVVTTLASDEISNESSMVTGSHLPSGSAGQVMIAYIQGQDFDGVPTGNGLTWVTIASVSFASDTARIWRAHVSSPSSGATTVPLTAATFGFCQVFEATGVNITGTDGENIVVQSDGDAWNGTNSGITQTLAAFADSVNNMTLQMVGHRSTAETAGSGFTLLTLNNETDFRVRGQFRLGEVLAPAMTWPEQSDDGAAFSVELAAAAAATSKLEAMSGVTRSWQ